MVPHLINFQILPARGQNEHMYGISSPNHNRVNMESSKIIYDYYEVAKIQIGNKNMKK
jgi:hypothetical protein